MDPRLNRIPENVRKIHFIAICGTGMGALAAMFRDMGFEVTGSDQNVYPPMSDFLLDKGITVTEGFKKEHIGDPDVVIVGNAVSKDNPEVLATTERGLPYCSMPQAVNRFAAAGKKQLLITGTHGKTTTSAILAWMLECAERDPSFVIGGILGNYGSNYKLGRGDAIVIEGDEYDTAFFDKGPKFLHYTPVGTAVTSVEFDHADIYRDLDHVKGAFGKLIGGLPEAGRLAVFDGDANAVELAQNAKCDLHTYGTGENCRWRLGETVVDPPFSVFQVFKDSALFGKFKTRLAGEHNLLDALAAMILADGVSVPAEAVAKAMETFRGVKRRQEIRGVKNGITVMDDFAHHPTAVRETIRAVRPFYPNSRIIAVFEPRTNTSMRNVFQDVYPKSFGLADIVCVREPSRLDKIPENERMSAKKMAEDLNALGKPAHFFPNTEDIMDFVVSEARPGDLVLIMSNGGFDNIHERLLKRLS